MTVPHIDTTTIQSRLQIIKAASGWTRIQLTQVINKETDLSPKSHTVRSWLDGKRQPGEMIRPALDKWIASTLSDLGISVGTVQSPKP